MTFTRRPSNNTVAAWTVAQAELKRLLEERIDVLLGKLRRSLLLTGALAVLSLLLAFLTYHHIVRPLARLEGLARTVRRTKDYRNRVDYKSEDEIGRLAVAFNEMLGELDSAHQREIAEQEKKGSSTYRGRASLRPRPFESFAQRLSGGDL